MQITIVGAGVVGLSIAHELVSRGAAVRIVDGRGPGRGATYASAGMLAPYIEGHSPSLLKLTLCSLKHYDSFIARVVEDSGRAVEYRRNGTLEIATEARGAARLAEAAPHLEGAQLLDAAAAREFEPGVGDVTSALFVARHGYVAVRQLVVALEAALANRGVVVAHERVEDLAAEAARADAVVVATGSWTTQLAGMPAGLDRHLRPVRGQLVQVRLPSPPASHVLWGPGCYLVPWQDGSVLIGATSEDVGFDERSTASGVRGLLDAAVKVLPALDGAAFEEVRVGLRPSTDDELPVIGRSSTMRGVCYATGHYRNGVLLAPWTALAVADLLLEGRERSELDLVKPERFRL